MAKKSKIAVFAEMNFNGGQLSVKVELSYACLNEQSLVFVKYRAAYRRVKIRKINFTLHNFPQF